MLGDSAQCSSCAGKQEEINQLKHRNEELQQEIISLRSQLQGHEALISRTLEHFTALRTDVEAAVPHLLPQSATAAAPAPVPKATAVKKEKSTSSKKSSQKLSQKKQSKLKPPKIAQSVADPSRKSLSPTAQPRSKQASPSRTSLSPAAHPRSKQSSPARNSLSPAAHPRSKQSSPARNSLSPPTNSHSKQASPVAGRSPRASTSAEKPRSKQPSPAGRSDALPTYSITTSSVGASNPPNPSSSSSPLPLEPAVETMSYILLVGSKEDRRILIKDLGQYLLNYDESKGLLPTDFGELNALFSPTPELARAAKANADRCKGCMLMAVLDGHMGSVTAEYGQAQLPFVLASLPEFREGNFERALQIACVTVHETLRDTCPQYKQEKLDMSNTASGATCSIAFSTPTTSYFSVLGDSPILYRARDTGLVTEVLPSNNWWQKDNRKRLLDSKFPIIVDEREFLLFTSAAQRDLSENSLRPGFSGVEPAGGLGDTVYDAKVFNGLLDILEDYKRDRLLEDVGKVKITLKLPAELVGTELVRKVLLDNTGWNTFYPFLKGYMEGRDEYKQYLKRQIRLDEAADSDVQQMQFLQFFLCISAKQSERQRLDPGIELMRRTPQTRAIPNQDMEFYCIMSDGVADYSSDLRVVQNVVERVQKAGSNNRKIVPAALMDYFRACPRDSRDDQTFILAAFP